MDEDPNSPEIDPGEVGEPCPHPEPRITNRAQGGVRSDKTRFIRPVERQRMRPWLIDHLDKNDIPGKLKAYNSRITSRIRGILVEKTCFLARSCTNDFVFKVKPDHQNIFSTNK